MAKHSRTRIRPKIEYTRNLCELANVKYKLIGASGTLLIYSEVRHKFYLVCLSVLNLTESQIRTLIDQCASVQRHARGEW